MAGVKGRSGGKRLGAGRKAKPKAPKAQVETVDATGEASPEPQQLPTTDDPLVFLMAVQNDPMTDIRTRVRAAIAAVQYKHTKRGDGGKKDDQADKAKKVAVGRFGPAAPPKLVVNNRGKS